MRDAGWHEGPPAHPRAARKLTALPALQCDSVDGALINCQRSFWFTVSFVGQLDLSEEAQSHPDLFKQS